ncbi:MAG: hypothetical protein R3C42_08760 [Parvularculaceae bacterium]
MAGGAGDLRRSAGNRPQRDDVDFDALERAMKGLAYVGAGLPGLNNKK